MLTAKAAHLGGVLVVGTVAATLSRSWVLALALAPLVVMLVVGLWPEATGPPAVRATLSGPRAVLLAGDEQETEVAIETERRAGLAEVALAPHPFVEAAPATMRGLRVLRPGAPARLTPLLKTPVRGRWPVGEVVVWQRGPGGLSVQETRVPIDQELRIMPRWEEIGPLRSLARRHRRTVGPQAARHLGTGSEFFGLRPYLPGDAIDAVNWRKTAKYGRPIVNEMEQDAPAEVVLLLDARASSTFGAGFHSTLEASVRAAVSIAHAELDDRKRVGLLVFGEKLEWTHPSTGRRQAQRITESLLDVTPIGRYDLLSALHHLPQNVIPSGATVVILTPALGDASLPACIRTLLSRRTGVLVVLVDHASAEASDGSLGVPGDIAARVLAPRSEERAEALRREGALVVVWDPREPLAAALVRGGALV